MTQERMPSVDVLRAVVVDDELLARQRMLTQLADCREPRCEVLAQAADAVQAMQHVQHLAPDLVLLDIHMPGANGMALARMLGSLPRPPALVFVTAHAEHAVEAFELEAVDYLTKPVRLERLQQALQKVQRHLNRYSVPADRPATLAASAVGPASHAGAGLLDWLLIQDRHRTERVPIADVLYFKAELKYVTVRTAARSYIWDGSLNDLEARYGDRFLRVHRNALIARACARALERHHDAEEGEGWALRLHGVDELISVSRRQLAAVRDMLAMR